MQTFAHLHSDESLKGNLVFLFSAVAVRGQSSQLSGFVVRKLLIAPRNSKDVVWQLFQPHLRNLSLRTCTLAMNRKRMQ